MWIEGLRIENTGWLARLYDLHLAVIVERTDTTVMDKYSVDTKYCAGN
jgi:hypothetical protein